MATQIARNNSRSSRCHCITISAVDKNFKANANSKNPKVTFTVFNQPPEEGREFNQPGKAANKVNGIASARAKPNIPTAGPSKDPPEAALTSNEPMIGPVQEKLTKLKVKAMKKMPTIPPLLDASSALFTQLEGNVISKAPKKLAANTTKSAKKARLNQGFVAILFKLSAPKRSVTKSPNPTYMTMIPVP